MDNKQHQVLKDTFNEIEKTLKDPDLNFEDRVKLETHRARLAGVILSSWLPMGLPRKLIMLIISVGAIYFFIQSQFIFAVITILIACLFSPRVVGEAAMFLGSRKN